MPVMKGDVLTGASYTVGGHRGRAADELERLGELVLEAEDLLYQPRVYAFFSYICGFDRWRAPCIYGFERWRGKYMPYIPYMCGFDHRVYAILTDGGAPIVYMLFPIVCMRF